MAKKRNNPLKILEVFLQALLSTKDRESLLGDFKEMYDRISKEGGVIRARCWYVFHIIKLIPAYAENKIYWSGEMFKNYLRIFIRNLKRHKGYSFINIGGLAAGMACCILILLYVQYELSYDRYHINGDQIYRILTNNGNATPPRFASALVDNFPEIIHAARVKKEVTSVKYQTKIFREDQFYFVDPDFLKIFTFPLVSGNPDTALNEPLSLILTKNMAQKYFGNEDPIGRVVSCNTYSKTFDYRVTGVLENIPDNSHFHFDFLASIPSLGNLRGEAYLGTWNNNAFKTYVLLADNSTVKDLEEKASAFVADKIPWKPKISLQILKDIHLFSDANPAFELEPNSNILYLYLFSLIAFFIMLIACFNYMNLATARSARRATEIGVRKVVGAQKGQLIQQFFSESVLLSLIALCLAFMLAALFLPALSSLIGSELNFRELNLVTAAGALLIVLFTGLISGIYPALFLSSFQPIAVLKNRLHAVKKNKSFFRNSLVVVQFVISGALIVCTITISQQLHYIQNRNLGFNKDYVLTATIGDRSLRENNEPLKNKLMKHPQITAVSTSSGLLTDIGWSNGPRWEGMPKDKNPNIYKLGVDFSYLDLYEMELAAGRKFSREFGTDEENAVILNETALKITGWENPIGRRFDEGTVVGIVKDFHFEPLREEIKPIYFRVLTNHNFSFFLSIKIKSDNIPATLAFIDKTWKKFSPDYPFDHTFVDSAIDNLYRTEKKIGNAFQYFSLLAVFIACLGLFGLTSFAVEQRTKEIGIRKVLGASVSNIFVLLSSEFTKLVFLANLVAWPVAYFAMSHWLRGFAYRTSFGYWIFLLSGTLTLFIALFTVGLQSIKAALADPVDSLRYE